MRGSSSNTGQSVMSSQLVRGRSMWSVKVTHFSALKNIKDDIICVKTYLVKTPPSPMVETVSVWKHSMCTLATGGLDFNSSAIVLVTNHQRLQVEFVSTPHNTTELWSFPLVQKMIIFSPTPNNYSQNVIFFQMKLAFIHFIYKLNIHQMLATTKKLDN